MTRTLGGKTPRTPSGRTFLAPLHGGPWLVQRVFWFFTSITLGGLTLLVGISFVYLELLKQPANAFIIFLMLAGAMMTVFAPLIGFVAWLTHRFTQICPECLGGMNRGAYVCPWCGFRETPRPEEHL